MLASHNASSDCARSPSYTEEGGREGGGEGGMKERGREGGSYNIQQNCNLYAAVSE